MSTIQKTHALAPIDAVRSEIQAMEGQFKMVLPPQISPEKFVRVVMTAVQMNPDLLAVDRKTLFSSAMKAAQDGLLPDGREGAIVTFNGKAQWMPMTGGILKKVRNSGELSSITSQIIHEGDKFRYWVDGDGEHVEHEPDLFGKRGAPKGVYALAKTKDGAVYIEVMSADQVRDVRDVSRAKNGPWNGPFEGEMWRKTAVRRLSKRLPMSTDLEQVIHRDDEMYDFKRGEERPVSDKGARLAQQIGLASTPEQEVKAEVEQDPVAPVATKTVIKAEKPQMASFMDFNDAPGADE